MYFSGWVRLIHGVCLRFAFRQAAHTFTKQHVLRMPTASGKLRCQFAAEQEVTKPHSSNQIHAGKNVLKLLKQKKRGEISACRNKPPGQFSPVSSLSSTNFWSYSLHEAMALESVHLLIRMETGGGGCLHCLSDYSVIKAEGKDV